MCLCYTVRRKRVCPWLCTCTCVQECKCMPVQSVRMRIACGSETVGDKRELRRPFACHVKSLYVGNPNCVFSSGVYSSSTAGPERVGALQFNGHLPH